MQSPCSACEEWTFLDTYTTDLRTATLEWDEMQVSHLELVLASHLWKRTSTNHLIVQLPQACGPIYEIGSTMWAFLGNACVITVARDATATNPTFCRNDYFEYWRFGKKRFSNEISKDLFIKDIKVPHFATFNNQSVALIM